MEKICVDRLLPRTKVAAFGIDVERGYGLPKLHAITKGCANQTMRASVRKFVPASSVRLGAIRISVSGWEAWVLQDLRVRSSSCSPCTQHQVLSNPIVGKFPLSRHKHLQAKHAALPHLSAKASPS